MNERNPVPERSKPLAALRPRRTGSIPMVLGLVMVLGILGGAALVLTGNLNRMDHRVDLRARSRQVARSAAEEVMLKLLNGTAHWSHAISGEENTARTVVPTATRGMFPEASMEIAPVRLMGRALEKPRHDTDERNAFYGLLAAGPRFAPNHDPSWDQHPNLDRRLQRLIRPPEGILPSPDVRAEFAERVFDPDEEDEVAKRFDELYDLHGGGGVAGLKEGLAAVGEEVVNQVEQASCGNTSPEDAVVASLAVLGQGQNVAESDPQLFEQIQEKAQAGGIQQKENFLVSLEARATARGDRSAVESSHMTHRIVSRLHHGEAMRYAYGRLLGYLQYHFRIPFSELEGAGMIDSTGEPVPANIIPILEARIPSRPNPQVWPFPVATQGPLAIANVD